MLETSDVKITFPCAQCSHRTIWSFQLVQHIQTWHNGHVHTPELFHATVEPELYICSRCDFKSNYKLDQYEHWVHETKRCEAFPKEFETYLCSYCQHGWHSSLSLTKHQNSCVASRSQCSYRARSKQHVKAKAENGKINWFDCNTCSYRSNKKSNFKRHLLKHVVADDIAWLKCGECSYRAKQKNDLKDHMLTHAKPDEIDWFACNDCSYRTKYKRSLKIHMLTHARAEDIVWFNCTECSFRSKRKSNLNKHALLVHTTNEAEITWFACETCSFRSTRKNNFKRHLLKHAAANWLNCAECSYRTKQPKQLAYHVATHAESEGIDWFSYANCSYRTKYKRCLKMHAVGHAKADDVVWFTCAECSFRSERKDSWRKHVAMMHISSDEKTRINTFEKQIVENSDLNKKLRQANIFRDMNTSFKSAQIKLNTNWYLLYIYNITGTYVLLI